GVPAFHSFSPTSRIAFSMISLLRLSEGCPSSRPAYVGDWNNWQRWITLPEYNLRSRPYFTSSSYAEDLAVASLPPLNLASRDSAVAPSRSRHICQSPECPLKKPKCNITIDPGAKPALARSFKCAWP